MEESCRDDASAKGVDSAWEDLCANEEQTLREYNARRCCHANSYPNFGTTKKKKKKSKAVVNTMMKLGNQRKMKAEECSNNQVRDLKQRIYAKLKDQADENKENTLVMLIKHEINMTASDDARKRQDALETLYNVLVENPGAPVEESMIVEAYEELVKPLLKRLADPREKCREIAISLLRDYMGKCKDLGRWMPYVFPAVMERNSQTFSIDFEHDEIVRDIELHEAKLRGKAVSLPDGGTVWKHAVVEPSEEIRLMSCEMMWTLVESLLRRDLHAMLGPYFHDSVMFFHACAVDPFPKLRMQGLNALERLGREERMCNTMHHYCTALVRSIMSGLRHKQMSVRIQCIKTIASLVSCPYKNKCRGGGTPAIVDLIGYREENVIPMCAFYQGETRINYFGNLLLDEKANVRMEFFRMLKEWMTSLPDRWDHAARLLPFLLSGVSDSSEDIQQFALSTLEILGKQHEEENRDCVIERRQYGIDGAQDWANYSKPWPKPWNSRPSMGSRMYVRNHCRRFLKPVLTELADWRSRTKKSAVGLLITCIVYMEEHITMESHLLVRTLFALIFDPEIGQQIETAAELAGRFINPDTYVPLILPRLESGQSDGWSARAKALRLLNQFITGTKPKEFYRHFAAVANAVTEDELIMAVRDIESLKTEHRHLIRTLLHLSCGSSNPETSTPHPSALEAHFIETGRLHSFQRHIQALARHVQQHH